MVEKLAAEFKLVCPAQDVVKDWPSSLYIAQVDEGKIHIIINQLKISKAKYVLWFYLKTKRAIDKAKTTFGKLIY